MSRKLKLKQFRSDLMVAAVLPLKFTADSPLFSLHGRFSLGRYFAAIWPLVLAAFWPPFCR
jgi:hypothetical protein